ncbi:MAG: TlpA family protein disulfide reductase [Bacteroidia bacterium]|nr:TlpA family protein disulfide reductase [Bacteroidia bacterium]
MKSIKLLFLVVILLIGKWNFAQEISFVKGSQITTWKANTSDTLYIYNFWATWCKPCIEELPAFEKVAKDYQGEKVKIILVSNDFKKQIDSKLKPFLVQNKIQSEVVFMDETNPNNWLGLVDENWSGAIPATLFVYGKKHQIGFHEGVLTEEELIQWIKKYIP